MRLSTVTTGAVERAVKTVEAEAAGLTAKREVLDAVSLRLAAGKAVSSFDAEAIAAEAGQPFELVTQLLEDLTA